MDEKELDAANFQDKIKNGKFTVRFDLDYDEWMKDKENNTAKFVNEISQVLHVKKHEIDVQNIKQGSVIIDWMVRNIWIPFFVKKLDDDKMAKTAEKVMNPQDQIECEYQGQWYPATIVQIINDGLEDGMRLKVRYNPRKGHNAFSWRNTEWFHSEKEASRLRLSNQVYTIKNEQGDTYQIPWQQPGLAERNNVDDIEEYDHIYVKFNEHWRRCEVVRTLNKDDGMWIKVFCLINGQCEGLALWKDEIRGRISFRDMR